MSSGGGFAPSQNSSNVTTNVAPTTSQTAPAPSGGKGGYNNSPMTMEDFAQQRPQVYMPPAQPTFYDQAFNSSYYNPGFQRPRMDYGLGSMGNAYVRRMPMYSPQTPIEASPPPSEMNYAPGGLEQAPQQLMSDSWSRRRMIPDDFQPLRQPLPHEYVGPTSQTTQTMPGGGLGGMPKQTVDPYQGSYQISEIPYQGGPRLTPVAATQGVRPEPNYSGGLASLLSGTTRQNLNPNASSPGAQPVGGWVTTAGGGMLWNA